MKGNSGKRPANGEQKRDLAQRRRGAEGENTKDCLPWFYSRGFAPFAGNALGGFAAEVGRFGETTLPLGFRWALPRLRLPLRFRWVGADRRDAPNFRRAAPSQVVADELTLAPERVLGQFEMFLPLADVVPVEAKSIALQKAYLHAGIVGEKWATDALHVALATTNRCRLIVSWNFKHIVHFDKIPLYNGVNLINGYDTLSINTPSEVIDYED